MEVLQMSIIESPESSSPLITRAVSAGLRNTYSDNYLFPGWQKAILLALGSLPQAVARVVISRYQAFSGLPPQVLDDFSIEQLIAERLADYALVPGRFPCITFGAGLSGAATCLSLALGGPFLPQAFVTTLRKGSRDAKVDEYLHRSLDRALQIAADHPDLLTIQHFDPVHDGWLTRWVNHLRFKLLDLPETYKDFIRSRLEPGGTIVYLNSGAKWLRYRLGPRSFFQVGGWGGIPADEYLTGSARLSAYARTAKLKQDHWALDDNNWPLESGPESEWGSEPGLKEALELFCMSEGYRFVCISLPKPDDFSRLAFVSFAKLLEKENRPATGILIEMFSQFDAHAALQSGLLPLWLIYNTWDSLSFMQKTSSIFP
jgi:hypothetical protein